MTQIDNAFTACLLGGMEHQWKKSGVESQVLYDNYEPTKQQSNTQSVLALKPEAVVFAVGIAPKVDAPNVATLERAGLPVVVSLENAPPGTHPVGVVNADEEVSGKKVVETLVKEAPETKEIGYIAGPLGYGASDEMLATVEKELAAQSPSTKIVDVQHGNFTGPMAQKLATDMIQANPGIEVIIADGDEQALAVLQAVKIAGANIKVVSVHGGTDSGARKEQEDGNILFTLAAPAATIGVETAEAAEAVLRGEKPGDDKVELPIITKDNFASAPIGCY